MCVLGGDLGRAVVFSHESLGEHLRSIDAGSYPRAKEPESLEVEPRQGASETPQMFLRHSQG